MLPFGNVHAVTTSGVLACLVNVLQRIESRHHHHVLYACVICWFVFFLAQGSERDGGGRLAAFCRGAGQLPPEGQLNF